MKCPSCGAEIGLLDKVCPYCGTVNTESSGHQAEMVHYKKQSEKTKGKLRRSIAQNKPIVISVVVFLFLVIGTFIAMDVAENASLYTHRARRREALKKSVEYKAELERYLEAEDYAGFVAYKELHVIPEYEEAYKEFEKVWDVAYYYCTAMNSIEEAVMFGADAKRYRMESYVSDCQRGIDMFYFEYESNVKELQDDYKYRDRILDMKEKVEVAMHVFLGLDEEGLREYLDSSQNKQEAYLEEVLIGE